MDLKDCKRKFGLWKCKNCDRIFVKEEAFRTHFQNEHLSTEPKNLTGPKKLTESCSSCPGENDTDK